MFRLTSHEWDGLKDVYCPSSYSIVFISPMPPILYFVWLLVECTVGNLGQIWARFWGLISTRPNQICIPDFAQNPNEHGCLRAQNTRLDRYVSEFQIAHSRHTVACLNGLSVLYFTMFRTKSIKASPPPSPSTLIKAQIMVAKAAQGKAKA